MTMYSNKNFLSADCSMRQISHDVTQTSKSYGIKRVAMISARSSFVPVRVTMLKSGVQCPNSRAQFCSVGLGSTTR